MAGFADLLVLCGSLVRATDGPFYLCYWPAHTLARPTRSWERLVSFASGRRHACGRRPFVGIEVLFEKVVQERADCADRSELADCRPGRRNGAANDVGCQFELQAQKKPHREAEPNFLSSSGV